MEKESYSDILELCFKIVSIQIHSTITYRSLVISTLYLSNILANMVMEYCQKYGTKMYEIFSVLTSKIIMGDLPKSRSLQEFSHLNFRYRLPGPFYITNSYDRNSRLSKCCVHLFVCFSDHILMYVSVVYLDTTCSRN